MPIESLFQTLEDELDLPSGSIKLCHFLIRPELKRQRRDQQDPTSPPDQLLIEILSPLFLQPLPFASLGLHSHLFGQAIGHQANLIALSIWCLDPPHDVASFPIRLPEQARLQINALSFLGLQSQMRSGGSGDGIGMLLEHDLNSGTSWIACIGHRDVSREELEPTQALGLMPIRDVDSNVNASAN